LYQNLHIASAAQQSARKRCREALQRCAARL